MTRLFVASAVCREAGENRLPTTTEGRARGASAVERSCSEIEMAERDHRAQSASTRLDVGVGVGGRFPQQLCLDGSARTLPVLLVAICQGKLASVQGALSHLITASEEANSDQSSDDDPAHKSAGFPATLTFRRGGAASTGDGAAGVPSPVD